MGLARSDLNQAVLRLCGKASSFGKSDRRTAERRHCHCLRLGRLQAERPIGVGDREDPNVAAVARSGVCCEVYSSPWQLPQDWLSNRPVTTGDQTTSDTPFFDRDSTDSDKHRFAQLVDGRLLIGKERLNAGSGDTLATLNPASGEIICRVASADAMDVDLAVAEARAALVRGRWARMSGAERARRLIALAELIEEHADELAMLETVDGGKPLRISRALDVPAAAAWFRHFAGWADKIDGQTIPAAGFFCYTRREPVGVVGMILPWNFPLLLLAWKLAPALACGNTCVVKPAEQTPLSALRLGELALEAGFPAGVVNIVPGIGSAAGDALARHGDVDKISFTGSTAVGRRILEASAQSNLKRISVELGGKSPQIVFRDADLDEAAKAVEAGAFLHQGQICTAGSRVFLHESVHDEFVQRIVDRVRRKRIGDPAYIATEHGPQIDAAHLEKVLGYVDAGVQEGADLLCGGKRVGDKGFFVEPAVFVGVRDEMKIARDEIFGPVLSVFRFQTVDEVVARANATEYGLAAGVWTRDLTLARRVAKAIQAGTVWVNTYNAFDPAAPFGGMKQSGFGREGGQAVLDEYTALKTVFEPE